MYTILQDSNNKLQLPFKGNHDFILIQFTNRNKAVTAVFENLAGLGCDYDINIVEVGSDGVVDLNNGEIKISPRATWKAKIYGQSDNINLAPINATYLYDYNFQVKGDSCVIYPTDVKACLDATAIVRTVSGHELAREEIAAGATKIIKLNVTVNKPIFETIESQNITNDSFDVFAQIDVEGTMYALLLEQGDPVPSVQDVIDNGVELPDEGDGNTFEFTELQEDTAYIVYLAAIDFAGTKIENVDSIEVSTNASFKTYIIPQDIRDAGFDSNTLLNLSTQELSTDYDFFKYRDSITGNTAYIDPDAPNGGDGSEENPFNNITTAFANSSFNIYLFKSGSVFKNLVGDTRIIPQTRPIKISTYGGSEKAEITSQIDLTGWAVNETFNNVYQTSHPTGTAQTQIGSACDMANLNEDGVPIGFSRQTSIANVSANAGSYYYDSSTLTVYIRTLDDREPDEDVRLFMNGTLLRLLRFGSAPVGGHEGFYMENIRVLGANPFRNMNGTSNPTFADFYNCEFNYAGQKDGFYLGGNHRGSTLDCNAYYPSGDGFNYNGQGYNLEWNCVSKYSTVGAGGNNGSTAHEDFTVIRVLGDYRFWPGKAVQDINNSRSLNIRCYVSDSIGSSPNDYAYASNSSSGFTRMWFYECIADQPRGYDNFNNSEMNIYDGDFGNLLEKENNDRAGSVLNILTENEVFE